MLLSLLYRSALHDARGVVSYFSLVAVGVHPRLLLDCSKVTQNNVTKALTCLAAYMLEVPALVDAPQPQPPRAATLHPPLHTVTYSHPPRCLAR